MTQLFSDEVALVTGGGTGSGRAIARAFARDGATVVVAGRARDRLEETVALIEADGGRGDAIVADVSSPPDVASLLDRILERHGGLHIAVNNAGILGTPSPVAELDDDTWSTVLATNLTGVWLSMKHEIAHMQGNGGGSIVNISSTVGPHLSIPSMGAYAATKAAVSSLTRTAAKEYCGKGVRINAISPGPIDTPMSRFPGETDEDRDVRLAQVLPIGRVGKKEEIAAAAMWLASPASGFVVGHDLVIDGGGTA